MIQIRGPSTPTYILDYFKLGKSSNAAIQKILDIDAIRVFHNAKFDIKMLWSSGLNVDSRLFDTMIAAQLLNCGLPRYKGKFGLAALCKEHLSVDLSKVEQVSDWSLPELSNEQLEYASTDVEVLIELREKLRDLIGSMGLGQVAKIEFDCIPAIATMEYYGMYLNVGHLAKLKPYYETRKREAEEILLRMFSDIYVQTKFTDDPLKDELEYRINLRSPAQILPQLQRAGIEDPKLIGELIASTDQQTIKLLNYKSNPMLKALIDYRAANTMLTKFVDRLPTNVHPVTGRIHASYWQLGTETGRLSCSNP